MGEQPNTKSSYYDDADDETIREWRVKMVMIVMEERIGVDRSGGMVQGMHKEGVDSV